MDSDAVRELLVKLASPPTVFPHYRLHTRDKGEEADHKVERTRDHVDAVFSNYEDFALNKNVNGGTSITFDAKNKFTGKRDHIARLHLKFTSGPCTNIKGSLKMPALQRRKKKRVLHAFDMDDTLFWYPEHSAALTWVVDAEGNRVRGLTPHELSEYDLGAGERFDYHDFEIAAKFKEAAVPIQRMHDKFHRLIEKGERVEIVTARNYFDDQDAFRKTLRDDFGIDVVVHMAGSRTQANSNGGRKKIVFREVIEEWNYDEVHLYDDSKHNVDAFLSLRFDYPNVKFIAHLVTYNEAKGTLSIKKMTS